MLQKLMKLYVMSMANDVRSPTPHLYGPPGAGKSRVVEQLAELVGCNLHVINVSRVSPLDVEGVQMPVNENTALKMLPATFWTQLKEGDILLLDEFLRGFDEVYNALLDILTSRRVGGYTIPKVFIIAASNSTATYDSALEDRLLHLPVADPRKSKAEHKRIAKTIVEAIGLMPAMADSMEMSKLLSMRVLPMYEMLDKGKGTSAAKYELHSPRNLIGQAKLREVQTVELAELISMNNLHATSLGKLQYLFLLDGKNPPSNYATALESMKATGRMTELQLLNSELNMQLIEMHELHSQKGTTSEDDDSIEPDDFI